MKPNTINQHKETIKALVTAGYTQAFIADKIGISKRSVQSVCHRYAIKRDKKIYIKTCRHCCICFKTRFVKQLFCSRYCADLSKRKYNNPPAELYCPTCDKTLPVKEFGKHSARPSGYNYQCNKCRAKKNGSPKELEKRRQREARYRNFKR